MKFPTQKDTTPLPERTAAAYKELVASAAVLNTTSDELSMFIASIDKSIQALNLGIEAWVDVESGWSDDRTGEFETHYLGYDKIKGTWGIALRVSRGSEHDPEVGNNEYWLFNEGPRELRVDAIDKLPELLQRLKKKAESTSKKISDKTAQAKELSEALKQAASELAAARKK
jgi:prefoldin subunit 5